MLDEIRKLVLSMDVKDLTIEEMYYYVLLVYELGLDDDYHYTDTLSKEDYE